MAIEYFWIEIKTLNISTDCFLCRAPALSVSGPGDFRALFVLGPGALCVGARRSLCRGPALSLCDALALFVSGPGALCV